MNLFFFIASRFRMGTGVCTVSVAISIAVIVAVSAVVDGFRSEIVSQVRTFSSDVVLVSPGNDIMNVSEPVDDSLSYLSALEDLPFVKSVSPVSYRKGIIMGKEDLSGILLKGVGSHYDMEAYAKSLREGRVPGLDTGSLSNEIMVSATLARELRIGVGDTVATFFPSEQVKVSSFTISGIFDLSLQQEDGYLAVGNITQLAAINGWDGKVSGYEIFLNNENMEVSREQIDAIDEVIYRFSTDDDSAVAAQVIREKYYNLFDWLNLLDMNVVIVLALMIAVAGFNMVSGLLIMLFERIAHIGLLKSLGMTDIAIAKAFLVKGATVVLKGMLWGNLVALGFCAIQGKFHLIPLNPENYFVSFVPVSVEVFSVLLVNLVAFAAIMMAMALPCMFISRIDPASTMRVK